MVIICKWITVTNRKLFQPWIDFLWAILYTISIWIEHLSVMYLYWYRTVGMSQFKAMKRKYVKNSESGQNPERYRHCMHGGAAWDEVSHWNNPEKAMQRRCWYVSQETCLNGNAYSFSELEWMGLVCMFCRKSAAAVWNGLPQFFICKIQFLEKNF